MASLEEAGRSVRQVAARISSASTIFSYFLSFPRRFEGSEYMRPTLATHYSLVNVFWQTYSRFFRKIYRYTLVVFKKLRSFCQVNFGKKCDK